MTEPSLRLDPPPGGPGVVADGVLYAPRRTDVIAVDVDSGERRWSFAPSFYLGDGGVAVADGTVYVGAHDDRVYAVDAAVGRARWRTQTRGGAATTPDDLVAPGAGFDGTGPYCPLSGGSVQSTPTVVDGVVYVGADDGRLYALSAADGRERWRVETGSRVWARPAVAGGVVYAGSNDGNCYAVDAASGEQRWAYPFPEGVVAGPVTVVDGEEHRPDGRRPGGAEADLGGGDGPDAVVAASVDGTVAALTPDRRERWRVAPTSGVVGLAVGDGVVYVAGDGELLALALADGNVRWRVDVDAPGTAPPRPGDGVVYVGDDDGRALALSAADGRRGWVVDCDAPVTLLAFDGNRVVVGDGDGGVRTVPRID